MTLMASSTWRGLHPGLNGPFVILGYDAEPSLVLVENKVSSLFLDEGEHIEAYTDAWSILRELALDPQASTEFLTTMATQIG